MKFHALTLFPEMIEQGLKPGIIGRAVEKGLISLNTVNIREYTRDRHGKVDDYPYGGGAGMLMQAQPVYDAWRAAVGDRKPRTIYLTPQGRPFSQSMARELAKEEELVLLCGHYEGIDQRVLEEIVTDYVSAGDYVLTGGELPAMVMIDAIARLVPGVLGNEDSAEEESFHNDLLEYPQYTRPEVWHGKRVPEVLLSGNHGKVSEWRLEQSKERTAGFRPDLYEKYREKQRLILRLSKDKRNNIHIMESLARGKGEILYHQGGDLLVQDRASSVCMLTAEKTESAGRLAEMLPEGTRWVIVSQDFVRELFVEKGCGLFGSCSQYLYTNKVFLPVRYKEIRRLTEEDTPYVTAHYAHDTEEYVRERVRAGVMYGAFSGERQIGFIGIHTEGSMGLLYVEEEFRRRGVAEALEAFCANRLLEKGFTPYGHIMEGNTPSEHLQEKLGFYRASRCVYWMSIT